MENVILSRFLNFVALLLLSGSWFLRFLAGFTSAIGAAVYNELRLCRLVD
jgi:hypothetical protein